MSILSNFPSGSSATAFYKVKEVKTKFGELREVDTGIKSDNNVVAFVVSVQGGNAGFIANDGYGWNQIDTDCVFSDYRDASNNIIVKYGNYWLKFNQNNNASEDVHILSIYK